MIKPSASVRGWFGFRGGQTVLSLQIALATVLLVGAGLFLHTLLNLRTVPMGYKPNGLLYFTVDTSRGSPAFVDAVVEQLAAIPGVTSATASMRPLFTSAPDTYLQVCGAGASRTFDDRYADSDVILPRFFETWGVPLLRGRDFTLSDRPGRVLVNQAFVQRYLAGRDGVGEVIRLGPGCFPSTIIGVVANSTDRPRVTPRPFVYRRYALPPPQITLTVRTRGNAATVAPALRRLEASLDARACLKMSPPENNTATIR